MNHRFHEWSLVAFTWTAIAGAGLLAASAMLDERGLACWGLCAIGVGFLVSTAHLGRMSRAALSLRRAGRSPLSNEVLIGGLTLASGIVWLIPPAAPGGAVLDAADSTRLAAGARVAAGATSSLFLLAVGLVYRLPGQRTWRGAATIGPLLAGLAFGAAGAALLSMAPPAWLYPAAWLLLAADAAVSFARWRAIGRSGSLPVHARLFERRHALMAGRIALFDLLPAVLLWIGGGAAAAAMATLAAGLLLDRVAFYGLAQRSTTDAELARVEDVIGTIAKAQ